MPTFDLARHRAAELGFSIDQSEVSPRMSFSVDQGKARVFPGSRFACLRPTHSAAALVINKTEGFLFHCLQPQGRVSNSTHTSNFAPACIKTQRLSA